MALFTLTLSPTAAPDYSAAATSNQPPTVYSSSVSPSSVLSAPSSVAPLSVISGPSSVISGASSVPSGATADLDDKHKLAIGDKVSFRIIEDLEDPTEPREPKALTVADSGELEIPYIGRITAEGRTCKQLARKIKAALEHEYYHQATVVLAVDLMAKSRGKVYLVGPVRLPGPQEIPSDEVLTLGKAIMRAGGFNDFADRRGVKVTRKGAGPASEKKTFFVDVAEIFDKGKVEHDPPLEPGDLILVPERGIRF